MTIDEFWKLLEGLDPDGAAEELTERLEELSPSEIEEFEAHFCRAFRQAYNRTLWSAAYLIDGGCSDDGFMDFRYGLISRGRRFYEAALKDPDSLAEMLTEEDFIPNEDFGYVASRVYEEKTGEPIPQPDLPPMGKPTGEKWNLQDPKLCAERLPKIWKRYGNA